jgi:hypothetical protein
MNKKHNQTLIVCYCNREKNRYQNKRVKEGEAMFQKTAEYVPKTEVQMKGLISWEQDLKKLASS